MSDKEPTPRVRPVTRDVYNALMGDEWPSQAGVIDFGIHSRRHFGALQWAVKCDGVTMEQLDRALGNGKALDRLISPRNPYRGVHFETNREGGLQVEPKWEIDI